jgi:hypothetical protein
MAVREGGEMRVIVVGFGEVEELMRLDRGPDCWKSEIRAPGSLAH